VAKLKCFGTTVTNQNYIHKAIKSRLSSENFCYHSVQNLLPSCLPYKIMKFKIWRTIILPTVLYGCETWSLTLWEEHRLKVAGNRVLRRISGSKREDVAGGWRKFYQDNIKMDLKYDMRVWTRFIWLRIWTSGGLL
jgi:hypothetical protein